MHHTTDSFERIAREEWEKIPAKFAARIKNVALLIEDKPSEETRKAEKLEGTATLLGLYHGIPATERGEWYGVGATMPDTITLYRLPIMDEARGHGGLDALRQVIRETIWHEVGHYFGLEEDIVEKREDEGTNAFK